MDKAIIVHSLFKRVIQLFLLIVYSHALLLFLRLLFTHILILLLPLHALLIAWFYRKALLYLHLHLLQALALFLRISALVLILLEGFGHFEDGFFRLYLTEITDLLFYMCEILVWSLTIDLDHLHCSKSDMLLTTRSWLHVVVVRSISLISLVGGGWLMKAELVYEMVSLWAKFIL